MWNERLVLNKFPDRQGIFVCSRFSVTLQKTKTCHTSKVIRPPVVLSDLRPGSQVTKATWFPTITYEFVYTMPYRMVPPVNAIVSDFICIAPGDGL